MNILFVWDGDYPWDIRVDKVCSSLVNNGHRVSLVCRNLARKPRRDAFNGTEIFRLPFTPKWTGNLNSVISFPAFFNPLWIYHIWKIAKTTRPDLIIARDLPMSPAALWVAKWLNIPCVLDMAECYPEMLRCAWKFEGKSFINFFVRNPVLADIVEKYVLKRIDQVWVMIEESATRLKKLQIPESKIRLVSNTPVVARFSHTSNPNQESSPLTLVYIGLLNPSRGLDTAIQAAIEYHKINPHFKFIIAGSGKAESRFRDQVDKENAGEFISFLGWLDNDKLPKLLNDADIGIVPHHRCGHWDNTIPNKLFDYMAAGVPVIVSDVPPMKRIVEDTNCGASYTDYNVDQLVNIISTLSNADTRKSLGDNGTNAVHNQYNWQRDEKVLLASIDDLTPDSRKK